MSTPFLELQKDIYAALTGDVTLMGKITGVFDFVPDNQAFPYLVVGDAEYQENGTHTFEGFSGDVTIHLFMRPGTRGRAALHSIMDDVYRLLHENTFSLPNFTVTSMRYDFSQILVEDDRVTYHGVQRFRILIGGN